MWMSDDEPREPGDAPDDIPVWWQNVVGGAVCVIIGTLALEALDGLLFRTDLPWQVCSAMAAVMTIGGGWICYRADTLQD